MDTDESLRRFGLNPAPGDLAQIRQVLEQESENEEQATILMRVLCLQLFNAGQAEDILNIWRAKDSGFDASCAIDVQFLCGLGLEPTRTYLAKDASPDALAALQYIDECVGTGDFAGFTPELYSHTMNASWSS